MVVTLIGTLIIGTNAYAGSYTYDVSGYDSEGNYVYGSIDANGSKDVDGYLYDEDGNSRYFSGEWIGKGEVEGHDDQGNSYDFEIE